MRVPRAAVLTVLLQLGSAAALAQDHVVKSMDVLREHLDVDKRQVVEANLVLTDAQADAFWPIYDGYQAELGALHERLARVVREYAAAHADGTITDARAVTLLDEAIAIDAAEVELRKRAAERLRAAIPGIEAARYLQIENKVHTVVKLELAEEIPLVE
jgi:hypothetical protein